MQLLVPMEIYLTMSLKELIIVKLRVTENLNYQCSFGFTNIEIDTDNVIVRT